LQKQEADLYSYPLDDLLNTAEHNTNVLSSLEEIIVYDNSFLLLRGWIYQKDSLENKSANRFIIFSCNDKQFICRTKIITRDDVVKHFNDISLCNSGFECLVDMEKIKEISQQEITIKAGILSNGILMHNDITSILLDKFN